MSGAWCRVATASLAVLLLLCCGRESDPIGRDVQSVKERSLPLRGRLIPTYGPGREDQVFRISWQIETDMAWTAYSGWVVAQLPEFQVGAREVDSLRLSRALEGDVYTLTLRRQSGDKDERIEATFEARPF